MQELNPPKANRATVPFSVRFTEAERARLAEEAAGVPLGSHIKNRLFGEAAPIRRRGPALKVHDRRSLAQALALLGRSRISSNLNQLAHAANIGALPVEPETEAELLAAVHGVQEIRRLLMSALGLQPEASL